MRFMCICLLVLALVVVCTTTGEAGGCRVAVSHGATYVAPTYYSPITTYALPVQTVFQVAPELVQQRISEIKEEQNRKLSEQSELAAERAAEKTLQKFANLLQQQQSSVPVTSADGDPLAGAAISGLENRTVATSSKVSAAEIYAIMQRNSCLKCHSSGNVVLTRERLDVMSQSQKEKLAASVNHDEDAKAMPSKDRKIPLADRRAITRWTHGG